MMMTRTEGRITQILLVDDHQVVREGLRAVLQAQADFRLIGESEDGSDAIRKVQQLRPDVLVLDLVLRGVQGLEVLRQVHKESPRTRVVVLSMHSDLAYVLEALHNGAAAYVLKSAPSSEVVQAIREAMAGNRYLAPPLSEEEVDAYERQLGGGKMDLYETLTTREREVCQLAAQGFTNNEIADKLCIGRRTVETHRASMMHKLSLKNQAELVQFAMRRGLVPQEQDRPMD
jgi:two-component system, NarL family, response regulator NreC